MNSIRSYLATIGAAVLLASAVASPAGATSRVSQLANGSFESPRVAANTFQLLGAGQSIGPWQITSGTLDLIGAGFWQAAEGDQSIDLNGSGPAIVSQTFTTTSGTAYSVTYSLAGNFGDSPRVKTGSVLIDGQNFQDFSFDTTGKTRAEMGYVTHQFTFVAMNPTTTLTFTSTTPNSIAGPVIDNVTVQPFPPCPHCG